MRVRRWWPAVILVVATSSVVACGGTSGSGSARTESGTRPTIVVTTNILGDVVSNLVGDAANVVTIMPVGADPHDFQASAQDAVAMRQADVLVTNGAGFEGGLQQVIDAAEADGAKTYEAISAVSTLELGEGGATDPHFFTDPRRMAAAARGISRFLASEVPALRSDAVRAHSAAYAAALDAHDRRVEHTLAAVPPSRRVLVTNHEVFGYFADRYHLDVVGTVIPSGSTNEGASAGDLANLADLIRKERVPAIFADTSAPDELADTLRREVGGDVEVVDLFSESLGPHGSGGDTYIKMMTADAERISDALA